MYIWIILAMFITALYGFNLHVRSDSHSLYVEPQAQMLVSKIALQHDTSSKFFSYVNEKVTSETKLEEAVEVCTKKDDNGDCISTGYASQKDSYEEGEDPFSSSIAPTLGDYTRLSDIPLNFDVVENKDNDFVKSFARMEGTNLAKNSHSRVFCVKSKDITSDEPFESYYFGPCTDGQGMNCCYGTDANDTKDLLDEEGNVVTDDDGNAVQTAKTGHEKSGGALYVVTYAPIPVRWQQRAENGVPTGLPNKDMIKAFRHFGLTNVEFGYLVDQDHYDWGDGKTGGGSHNFFDSESEGEIKDIQTNAMTDYTVEDFKYFLKGFKDTPVGIPTVIGLSLMTGENHPCGTSTQKPSCIVAISQIK